MGRFWLFFFFADIALTAAALISCLSTEDSDIRAFPRAIWVIIILLFSPVGSIAWFVAGKERYSGPRKSTWRPGSGFPEYDRPNRTVAPDDNPDFLRNLDRQRAELDAAQRNEEEREMLRKWETDLKRREEELRKRDNPED